MSRICKFFAITAIAATFAATGCGASPEPTPTVTVTADASEQTAASAIKDGDDPMLANCASETDVATLKRAVQADGAAIVELKYSKSCSAVWSKITTTTPADSITATVDSGARSQSDTMTGYTIVFSNLIVVNGPNDPACATGSYTLNGVETAVATPACN